MSPRPARPSQPAEAVLRTALRACVALAVLGAGGCITWDWCPCADPELHPVRPGMDGRSSATLDVRAAPGYNSRLRGDAFAAFTEERTP